MRTTYFRLYKKELAHFSLEQKKSSTSNDVED